MKNNKNKQKLYNLFPFLYSLCKNIIILLSLNFKYLFFIRRKKQRIIMVVLIEHMGDIVACEPVSRYIKKENPDDFIIWIVKKEYKDIVRCNPNVDKTVCVTGLTELILLSFFKFFIREINLHISKRKYKPFFNFFISRKRFRVTLKNYYEYGSLLEAVCLAANIKKLNDPPIFHFCKDLKSVDLPKKPYAVFHCVSNQPVKNWGSHNFTRLANDVIDMGFNVAEIGFTGIIKLNTDNYYNLCGRYSLQEYAYIIKNASVFIGIDSGFSHIANAVNTYGIILIGELGNFKRYNPYTGGYGNGENAAIIYNEKGKLMNLNYNRVLLQCIDILNKIKSNA